VSLVGVDGTVPGSRVDLRDPTLLGRDRRAGRGQPAAPPAGREPREDEDPDDEWRVYSDGVGGPSRPCEPRAVSKVESRSVRLDGSFASPWLAFSDNERDRLQPVVLCWKCDNARACPTSPARRARGSAGAKWRVIRWVSIARRRIRRPFARSCSHTGSAVSLDGLGSVVLRTPLSGASSRAVTVAPASPPARGPGNTEALPAGSWSAAAWLPHPRRGRQKRLPGVRPSQLKPAAVTFLTVAVKQPPRRAGMPNVVRPAAPVTARLEI